MVAIKNPIFVQVGADANFNAGTNTATFNGSNSSLDLRGLNLLPTRVQAGPLIPGVDYSWNAGTGVLTLLQPGDVFAPNEYFKFEFDSYQSVEQYAGYVGNNFQYRHILRYSIVDQSGPTTVKTDYERRCRIEFNANYLKGVASNDESYIGIIHMAKPAQVIPEKTPVKVYYEDGTLLSANVVRQFRIGYLNARAWV